MEAEMALTPEERARLSSTSLTLVGVRRGHRDPVLLGGSPVVDVNLAASDPDWLQTLKARALEHYQHQQELEQLISAGIWPGHQSRIVLASAWWRDDEERFEPKRTRWAVPDRPQPG
jgi:hypothetical protein